MQKQQFVIGYTLLVIFLKIPSPQIFGKPLNNNKILGLEQKREALLRRVGRNSSAANIHLGYAAACISVLNEHNSIREWVQYHIWLGINKIYVFDNGSNPPMVLLLEDFAKSGQVEVFYFTTSYKLDDFKIGKLNDHMIWVANACLSWSGHRHKFMAIFDIDEFIVFPNNLQTKLPNFLKNFEETGGLKIYRRFFGSNGHIQIPQGGVLESFTKCAKNVRTFKQFQKFKVIVNMKYYNGRCKTHNCGTTKNMLVASPQKIQFFHYFIKSYEDLKQKWIRKIYKGFITIDDVQKRVDKFYNLINKQTRTNCLQGITLYQMCCTNISNISNSNISYIEQQQLQYQSM